MKIDMKGARAFARGWRYIVGGFALACLMAVAFPWAHAAETPAGKPMTVAEVLAAAKAEDWRLLDPENTVYLELAGGRVVIELAPMFAPRHAANVKALAREKYFDGLAIVRVQDNYVVQWGDPNAEDPARARKILDAKRTLPAEFDRPCGDDLPFTPLPDGDVYAGEVGFVSGFPAARDKASGRMWLVHCYGMVGAGRGDAADSGGGAEDYAVIGHAPRHLDRNCTLFGRVVQGMEVLSSLPRASGPMGFIEKPEQCIPIRSVRVVADVPPAERSELEVLRTDSGTFRRLIKARRERSEEWFLHKPGRVEICNVPVPVRVRGASPQAFDARLQGVREKVAGLVSAGQAASMSIAVAKDGKIVWEEAFGWADVEKKFRATPRTRYRSGSIAKTITATGLMTLVEKGLVDLDRPVLDYAPRLKIRSFVGGEREVTVRHVLNHRSGMPPYCEFFFANEADGPRDLPETVRRYGIVAFAPGRSFLYCNLGYQLIGYLISQVSGTEFSRFMEKSVFLPLKMAEAGVKEGNRAPDQAAVCYTPGFRPIPDYRASYPGASDMYLSAHDLVRFAMFHLKDRLPDQDAILSNDAIGKMQEAFPPGNASYGIGWYFDINEAGYRSVYHGGEVPGADNFMRLVPAEDLALVILCNSEIGDHLGEIQEEICAALIPGFSKAREEGGPAAGPPGERRIAEGLLGKWKGRIVAYDREIVAELEISNEAGAKIVLSGQEKVQLDLSVATDGFLMGDFPGLIPTADGRRHGDRVRLALVRRGDRLSGQATATQWVETRQANYELSSWIELTRK